LYKRRAAGCKSGSAALPLASGGASGNEWVAGVAQGPSVVKVSVADVRVEHAVKFADFMKWVLGFYARRGLPYLINAAMKNKEATRLRGAWVPEARGRVLEIGIGSGLNFPFYSSEVECVFCCWGTARVSGST